jgi:hypothetical protein
MFADFFNVKVELLISKLASWSLVFHPQCEAKTDTGVSVDPALVLPNWLGGLCVHYA